MSIIWQKNDDVIFSYDGGMPMPGLVTLASANGRSLVIAFDGMLDGLVGAMPILQGDDGSFRCLLTHKLVDIVGGLAA